jgi:prophage maintenance system killer protein
MSKIEYLSTSQLIEINERVLKEIKVKRADSHRVANRTKLDSILDEVRELEGDAYDKASRLMIGLTREHVFDSGNRRTAYTATKLFLEANGATLDAEPDPRVLTGIREGFYRMEEVVEWLKGNGIREFQRHNL